MYLASLFASLICGHIVQADTIIAEPAYLILQGQSEKIESHGQFSVHLEEGQVQLSFDPKGQNKAAFQTFYSKIQGIYFLKNATDSAEDRYAAQRFLDMGIQDYDLFRQVA